MSASLSFPKPTYRHRISGVAQEVVTTYTLDGYDQSLS
jgi:hypothetical protein